jgi:alpha-ketoglutarate-dependent 2,4-dichlorophenoxyacetate dioxygenase
MSISITEIHPLLGARVEGVDLRQPITADDVAFIEQSIARYPVLVFPAQIIDDRQQIEFSLNFGTLQTATTYATNPDRHRLAAVITDVSNVGKDNQTFGPGDRRRMNALGSRRWHSDSSYQTVPAKYSLLSARTIPGVGGETQFADMRAAYDALPDHLRTLVEDLLVEHNVIYSRAVVGFTDFSEDERSALPPVHQRLVRRHPISRRRSLFLSGHASHIVGWPLPQGRDLLYQLSDFATQPQFVFEHRWTVGDLVMWDNRSLMHRARPYFPETATRDMHRTSVNDVSSTLDQPN